MSRLSRHFSAIVPLLNARSRSRAFASRHQRLFAHRGYYCHRRHNTRATTSPRRARERRAPSTFIRVHRPSADLGPFSAASTMTIHSLAGVPLMSSSLRQLATVIIAAHNSQASRVAGRQSRLAAAVSRLRGIERLFSHARREQPRALLHDSKRMSSRPAWTTPSSLSGQLKSTSRKDFEPERRRAYLE